MKLHEMSPAVQEIAAKALSEAVLRATEFETNSKLYQEAANTAEDIAMVIRRAFEKLYD